MTASPVTSRAPPRWWRARRAEQSIVGYGFLIPDVVGLAVFVALPILGAVYFSFHEWTGIGNRQWNGLANYQELFHDASFLQSLKLTALYTFSFVPLLYLSALGLALLVNQGLKLTGLLRSAFFAPYMVSLVVASVVWSFILEDPAGVINTVIGWLGIRPQPWLGSMRLAMISVTIVTLWQSAGYSMIIFLAGLQDIPAVYYEAARIDGAGAWQRFRRITLPLLKRTSIFVLLVSFIGAFQLFDPIFVMTKGGPADATTTAVYYIYQQAFQFLRLGYASALSVVLFAIILVFSLLQLRMFRDEAAE